MKPYIFLSENYLKNTVDGNSATIDIRNISEYVPYTVVVYFTDIYGNPTSRTVDTIILKDTNIKNLTLEAKGVGGTYSTLLTLSGNTSSTVIAKAATPALTTSIRITVPDDGENPAEVRAKIGAYGFVCNLLALTDSNYKTVANQGDYRVVSGALVHWADYKKWNGKVKMENVTKEQFDLLTAQADKGEMTVVPYTELEATAIYECGVDREYSYGLDRKTELFNVELEFNEL